MKLTESQRHAVEHDGRNLQLIACAGSGKTEVVARRVVHLLTPGRPGALQPLNIIAFTFTDKAAAELKERIVTRTRDTLGEIAGMAEMFVGTIHAFCLELLKSESPKYLKYEVLNEVQQGLFVHRHSNRSGLTTSTDLAGAQLKRNQDTNRYISALAILREAERDEAHLDGCSILSGLDAYSELLDERSYLDYSSILEAAVEALTNDAPLREREHVRVPRAALRARAPAGRRRADRGALLPRGRRVLQRHRPERARDAARGRRVAGRLPAPLRGERVARARPLRRPLRVRPRGPARAPRPQRAPRALKCRGQRCACSVRAMVSAGRARRGRAAS